MDDNLVSELDEPEALPTEDPELEEPEHRFGGPTTSRRSLLKGAGVAAGGIAALTALGAVGASAAAPAGAAVPGPDVPYPGAPTIAASLNANGVHINGEYGFGEDNAIECVYFEQKASVPIAAGSGMATGKRRYEPLVIRKPIDSATPLLHKALVQNQNIDGTFKFYRPTNDNEYYTVAIKNGRIASIDDWSPDRESLAGQGGGGRPMQEVAITFQSISWTYGDISYLDTGSSKI